jgi:hypothetical protein
MIYVISHVYEKETNNSTNNIDGEHEDTLLFHLTQSSAQTSSQSGSQSSSLLLSPPFLSTSLSSSLVPSSDSITSTNRIRNLGLSLLENYEKEKEMEKGELQQNDNSISVNMENI